MNVDQYTLLAFAALVLAGIATVVIEGPSGLPRLALYVGFGFAMGYTASRLSRGPR